MDVQLDWAKRAYSEDYFHYISPRADDRETADMVRIIGDLLEMEPGARILDLCCGAGRHTVTLADRGYTVVGVDRSFAGLELARGQITLRANSAQVVCADVRNLPFGRNFDAAVSLFSSFGYLPSVAEDAALVREFCRVLRPGGYFLLDVVNPILPMLGRESRVWRQARGRFVLEERSYDPASGISTSVRTVISDGFRLKSIVTYIRIYTLAELARILGDAGLCISKVRGDYQGGPYDAMTSPRLIVLAVQP